MGAGMEENKNENAPIGSADIFSEKFKKFGKFYISLVIICIAICAIAVIVAVYLTVLGGLLLAMAAAVLYRWLLVEAMRTQLGVGYRRVSGGVACSLIKIATPLYRKDPWELCEERYLPSRLIFLDVVEICESEIGGIADDFVSEIHIPSSVKRIDGRAFSGMHSIKKIYYAGTLEQWSDVECLADLSGIELVCADGEK